MKWFVTNLGFAVLWLLVTGEFDVASLLFGFVIGYVVLLLSAPAIGLGRAFVRPKSVSVVRFMFFYLGQVLRANLRVAFDVVTPRHHMLPGVVAIPLSVRSDIEIALFANLISLTPGTLNLDLAADRKTLYIHAMYIDNGDLAAFRAAIKDGLEKRVLELLR